MPKNKFFSDGSSRYPYPHKLPDFLYHGTLGSKVKSIMARGLDPRGDGAASDDLTSPSVRDYVYLGTGKCAANNICRVMEWNLVPKKGVEDSVVILRADTSFLKKRLLRPDEDWCTSLWNVEPPDYSEDSGKWMFEGSVYPDEEEAVLAATGELIEWARRCWYDSLVEEESVAYKGIIPPEAIAVVATDESDHGLRSLRGVYRSKYVEMTSRSRRDEFSVEGEALGKSAPTEYLT
ncbi:MAG TPA: hypothetical protein VGS27_34995 [Candidatus Sulfotelmatobacter sp.]|nr:hypothetical protein [Candidatus Sulfotelmatobacter sp.]